MNKEVVIPRSVGEDGNSLLDLLSILPWNHDSSISSVSVDFGNVEFLTPGAIAALSCWVRKLKESKVVVELINVETSSASQYLQRIDFFSSCGLELPEHFVRHPPRNRFFPLTPIASMKDVESVSSQIACCIAPESVDSDDPDQTGLFDLLTYSISELATNVVQHSRSRGIICAQYYQVSDKVVVGIADSGVGIRESFRINGSPYWSDSMTDSKAIEKALEFKVSSRTHITSAWGEPINAGVGLTFLKNLVSISGGELYIVSGDAFRSEISGKISTKSTRYDGTLTIISFQRSKVSNFNKMFDQIKSEHKGTNSDGHEDMFQ